MDRDLAEMTPGERYLRFTFGPKAGADDDYRPRPSETPVDFLAALKAADFAAGERAGAIRELKRIRGVYLSSVPYLADPAVQAFNGWLLTRLDELEG